jgi:hypothetical protein
MEKTILYKVTYKQQELIFSTTTLYIATNDINELYNIYGLEHKLKIKPIKVINLL